VKRQISFLPLFLAALSIVFAATVFVRIRTHDSNGEKRLTASPETSAGDSQGDLQIAVPSQSAMEETASSLTGNANASNGVGGPHLSPREQRFDQLLRASHPASPVPTSSAAPRPQVPSQPLPPIPQQTLSRTLVPVVNALNGRNAQDPSQPQPNRPRDVGQGSNPRDPAPHNDKDPTSDTTPPQLVGVQFDPPAIHDGEDTTLTVIATDDLSGIRNISGSVISPTLKAVEGFALQSAGDGNRWMGRITVPKDAEEGLWHINFLSLTDNASNTQNINFSQGTLPPTAQFRVSSSRPDSTPPTLKAVWLDKPAISNGEKVTIFVTAVDDKSGTNVVSGVFQSPSKFAHIGFGCRPGDGDTWTCDMTPPKCSDCGNWQLEQIQLQDKAGNMATVRADNPIVAGVRLNVSGQSCDSTPPQMSLLVIDPTVVSNVDVSTINLTATVSDDICGVASVSARAVGPVATSGLPIAFSPAGEGQWIGHLSVPKLVAKGTWSIVWVQVQDKGNNIKTYSQSDPVLANAKFVVH
jgi:hypothetical protein